MVNLQIRIDEELRTQAQHVAAALGMDLTTAVRVFLKQMVADNALPFRPELDPFYSASNTAALRNSITQAQAGQLIHKTMAELDAMAQ